MAFLAIKGLSLIHLEWNKMNFNTECNLDIIIGLLPVRGGELIGKCLFQFQIKAILHETLARAIIAASNLTESTGVIVMEEKSKVDSLKGKNKGRMKGRTQMTKAPSQFAESISK